MNGSMFKTIREGLGLSRDDLSAKLDVNERSVRRWERGEKMIPEGISKEMTDMFLVFNDRVFDIVEKIEDGKHDGVLTAETREDRSVAWAVLQLTSCDTVSAENGNEES